MATIRNIFVNGFRPGYLSVMLNKVGLRIFEYRRRKEAERSRRWCDDVVEPLAPFLKNLDGELWSETQSFQKRMEKHALEKLAALNFDLGGGGDYRLLYFLVRYRQPTCVVETGVAAGFSSQAILSALAENGQGDLYSSDFPYFRIEEPERYIGYLVDDELKTNWKLYIEGDGKNLRIISESVQKIDLFHYDSDKSTSGRAFALRTLAGAMGEDSILIMDDIQDNLFFRNYVRDRDSDFHVFAFENKYLGLIGL